MLLREQGGANEERLGSCGIRSHSLASDSLWAGTGHAKHLHFVQPQRLYFLPAVQGKNWVIELVFEATDGQAAIQMEHPDVKTGHEFLSPMEFHNPRSGPWDLQSRRCCLGGCAPLGRSFPQRQNMNSQRKKDNAQTATAPLLSFPLLDVKHEVCCFVLGQLWLAWQARRAGLMWARMLFLWRAKHFGVQMLRVAISRTCV